VEVLKVVPRGYCYGVVDAIQVARRLAKDPAVRRPIFVLGAIVHNRHVVDELRALGIVTVERPGATRDELLDGLPGGGGTVLFTAHGVSPAVRRRAEERGFAVVDATCPDVERTHALIRELVANGREILYIGRRGHPEPEGAMGEGAGHVHLVECVEDLDEVRLPGDAPLAVVTQTTMSLWDTAELIAEIRRRHPSAEVFNEICRATQDRQEAAVAMAADADLVIVVGDERSNNTTRLVEVVRNVAHRPAYRVDGVEDLDPAWLEGRRRVAVTAGSSTPTHRTREVIAFLERYGEPAPSDAPAAADEAAAAGSAPPSARSPSASPR
jgi:4-hydroxy-3-methylbut-2-enyl diphosphate reductase